MSRFASYEVFGLVQRTNWRDPDAGRVAYLSDREDLLNGDLLDQNALINAIADSRSDEIYNLATQSLVPASFSHRDRGTARPGSAVFDLRRGRAFAAVEVMVS